MQNRKKIDINELLLSVSVGVTVFVAMAVIGIQSYQSSIAAGQPANVETPAFMAIIGGFIGGWLTFNRKLFLDGFLARLNETESEREERLEDASVIPYLTGEKESQATGDELGDALRQAKEKREKYAAKREGREFESTQPTLSPAQSRPLVNPTRAITAWGNETANSRPVQAPASWRELPKGAIWAGYDKVTNEPLEMSMRTPWLINGMTGYGKSTLIRVVAAQAIASGYEVHAVDPSMFTDFKAMDGYILPVDVSASPDNDGDRRHAIEHFQGYLRTVLTEMSERRQVMANAGSQDISDHPEYPRILILLDEFDLLVSESMRQDDLWPDIKDMVENVCLRGRKYGIHAIFMVHYPIREVFTAQMKTQSRMLTFHQEDETALRLCGYKEANELGVGEFGFNGRVFRAWPAVDAAIKATIYNSDAQPLGVTIKDSLRSSNDVQHQPTPEPTPLDTGVESGVEWSSTPDFGDLTPAQHYSTPVVNTGRKSLIPIAFGIVDSVKNGTHPRHSSPTNEPLTQAEMLAAKELERMGYSQRQLVDAFYTSYNPKSVERIKEALGD